MTILLTDGVIRDSHGTDYQYDAISDMQRRLFDAPGVKTQNTAILHRLINPYFEAFHTVHSCSQSILFIPTECT